MAGAAAVRMQAVKQYLGLWPKAWYCSVSFSKHVALAAC
jgi:hypothetical protein